MLHSEKGATKSCYQPCFTRVSVSSTMVKITNYGSMVVMMVNHGFVDHGQPWSEYHFPQSSGQEVSHFIM